MSIDKSNMRRHLEGEYEEGSQEFISDRHWSVHFRFRTQFSHRLETAELGLKLEALEDDLEEEVELDLLFGAEEETNAQVRKASTSWKNTPEAYPNFKQFNICLLMFDSRPESFANLQTVFFSYGRSTFEALLRTLRKSKPSGDAFLDIRSRRRTTGARMGASTASTARRARRTRPARRCRAS